jgi:hypothetical protein
MVASQHFPSVLFANEHACIAYLFNKRYPVGFICPFCGIGQREVVPSSSVVCRHCRKQTSLTAQTLMHGSKKNLVSWMRVAWQFCSRDEGMSARELQHLMELSSYPTAWRWLQKIRCAAAIAEKAKCGGPVLFYSGVQTAIISSDDSSPEICMALELGTQTVPAGRVRFAVLNSHSAVAVANVLSLLVERNSCVFASGDLLCKDKLAELYHITEPVVGQLEEGRRVFREVSLWLERVYRGAVERRYLQNYLNEFSFRYNTSSWPDRVLVLDHLLDGLVARGKSKHMLRLGNVEG